MTKLLEKMAHRKELKWPLKIFMLFIGAPLYILRAIAIDLTRSAKSKTKSE